MSRLYDRVMAHGWRPLSALDYTDVAWEKESFRQRLGPRFPDERRLEGAFRHFLADLSADAWQVGVRPDAIANAVVFDVHEVGDYVFDRHYGDDTASIVECVVPPYESLWLEFGSSWCPMTRVRAWGVLATADPREGEWETEGHTYTDGWELGAAAFVEWRKREPVGPVAYWSLPLDSFGRLIDDNTRPMVFTTVPELEYIGDEEFARWPAALSYMIGAALFAISLMHCKNVDVRPVDPPERLSRKHQRKYGRPLTRYHVLDIQPMRRILDSEGEAQSKGLRHALHICRGHFKTFTEDSPLFGRHTGTYWWESQVRGKAERGIVDKDYRVRLDQGLGREYVEADEHPEIQATAPEHSGLDPDLGGRGLRAHNATQNLLAQAVREAGFEPRRPKPDEPQYDIAWENADTTWVAEVKSVTPQNEERQLRTALGQVLRYRQLLEAEGRTVKAMIATEVEPSDPSWIDLCAREEVALVWAPDDLAVE